MQTAHRQPSHAPAQPSGRPAAKRRPAPRQKPARAGTRVIVAHGDIFHAVHVSRRLVALIGLGLLLLVGLSAGGVALYLGGEKAPIFTEADEAVLRQAMETVIRQRREAELKAKLSHDYENRLADLRGEMDRLTERQQIDKSTVEQAVGRVLDRQEQLAKRQDLLARITDAAKRAGFDVKVPVATPRPKKGSKNSSPSASAAPVARPSVQLASVVGGAGHLKPADVARIAKIETDVDAMERAQEATVAGLTRSVASRADRIAAVLQKVGRKAPGGRSNDDAVGGPFVPLPDDPSPARFALGVKTLSAELDRLAATRRIALSLPWDAPLGNAPISSGFGARTDPFLGRPAMHTGVDFRAPMGYSAPAALGGTVVSAGWEGGYGNMVDIDHGNGIVTRYGHLSAIKVKVGQKVAEGQEIGKVGSTGRSTGTHLHYEIRINGKPIDPMTYIVPGREMSRLL
ncbi:Murein DD-endopeptidase MepM and murein hydrolase activator NlpD, contain LysM domain [Kaistia soli DSM 19436]|uniref:Murein DD-endopeptidase MepM and murein hydrolase activator NlpD, contain LysM domain n=1 Tax=Kaistia soli DSM 19436 TaxID=1122133 RepID=A0A1M5GYE9_9HYPH|nr:M23 family metallopeptidase [Kaistia soli]SHG08716.1 Murein DD-endopeptidase MepM and murein hydrolase activator NlpD, contain LysM domain [Kaistia soli DSM 19436]